MKIRNVNICGIGGIKRLDLNFCDRFNVICGANGIGKITILNVITDAFSRRSTLKRDAQYKNGCYDIVYSIKGIIKTTRKEICKFEPDDAVYKGQHELSKHLIRFDATRLFDHNKFAGISPDSDMGSYETLKIIEASLRAGEIKNWFVSGKDIDILLSTPSEDKYFEYLSSGYKSCIYIIMGIMKEIEYRFSDNPMVISDFDGCILIDEIEEYLHPTWQAQLVRALKEIFPNAQFIVTTHSPSILQSVDKGEIIPLYFDKNGNTVVNHLDLGEYALQGWTLEEILQDVMGMPSTTSEIYQKTINAFDKAMYDENIPEIKRNYDILDKMLHPNNIFRKLLQIQMIGLDGETCIETSTNIS